MATEAMSQALPETIGDPDRLAALQRSAILDTPPEAAFDRLTRLAARVLATPVAAISFIDQNRQFVKSHVGLDDVADLHAIPLDQSICKYAVASRAPVAIRDTRHDVRARGNPLLSNKGISSYAGVPLITRDGQAIGTFCVADAAPRNWTNEELSLLSDLAASAMDKVELIAEVVDRKRAEARLRETNGALSALVDASPVGIIALDASYRVVTWNAAAERTFGYSEDEVVGAPAPIVPKERWEEFQRLLEAYRDGRGSVPYEARTARKDATPVDVVIRAATLRDEAGVNSGFLCIVTDITERKELERRQHQVQKMEALTRLATGIAHDFNNVLMAVRGNCDLLLQDTPPTDPRRAGLEEIANATDRAMTLGRQLLAFGERSAKELAPLDLNAIVEEAADLLRRILGDDIELTTIHGPTVGVLMADQSRLEQLLVNLAVNARELMPTGGRLIVRTADVTLGADYVRQHPDVRPGHYVMLSVTDTGRGMSAETLSRIFEPYVAPHDAPHRGGLGLTIVYAIVQQHGGYIQVHSGPGRGTTFDIFFPRHDAENPSGRVGEPRPSLETMPRGSETIMVVEDQDAVRKLTRRILERQGYRVIEARHGQEALDLFSDRGKDIDLVLSDVMMPEMGGRELIPRLLSLRPDARILLMSGFADGGPMPVRSDGGSVAFLPKPFTPDVLLARVRAVLDAGERVA